MDGEAVFAKELMWIINTTQVADVFDVKVEHEDGKYYGLVLRN